jgi:hypothetical protein
LLSKLQGKGENEQLERDLTTAFQAIKGTSEYWRRVMGDLTVMDEELGPSTWFVTLSCAELHWVPLEEHLRVRNRDLEGIEKMSTADLCQKDPTGVSEFFHRKFEAFMSEVLLKPDGPLGEVEHYFWRLEYQARGAPHIHMKLWVKDAPILGEDGVTEAMVLEFIEKHVTCAMPRPEVNKALYEAVKKFQVHKCTKSCLRRKKAKGKGKGWYACCRYGFPRQVQWKAEINGVAETVKANVKGKGKKKLYSLRRAEGEQNVNDYNPTVLQAWGANIDVQFVGENTHILTKYITGYLTKAEKTETQGIWDALGSDMNPGARLKKLMYACNKNREVGTYETIADMMNYHLHGASIAVEWLGVGMPEKRTRAFKKFKELEKMKEDDEEIFQPNMVENHYPGRHDDLAGESIYEVAQWWRYERVNKQEEAAREMEQAKLLAGLRGKALEEAKAVIAAKEAKRNKKRKVCKDGNGCLKKRAKRVLLKTRYVAAVVERAEEFFQLLLQLHVPYRDEAKLKRGKETYAEAYLEWEKEIPVLKERKAHKEWLRKVEELKQRLENEAEMEAEQEEAQEAGQWPGGAPEVQAGGIDPNGFMARTDYLTQEGLAKRVASLNEKQRQVYERVIGVVKHQLAHEESGILCEKPEQLLEFVSGGAGTGKSRLIEVVTEGVQMLSDRRVLIGAPTGLAAQNIAGETLHSVFNLPIQKEGKKFQYEDQGHEMDKKMADRMWQTKLIIIDEISMVSNVTLMFIHLRMMGMLNLKDDSVFAGFNLLVLGDLMQLPPVDRSKMGYCFERIKKDQLKASLPGNVVTQTLDNLWARFSYSELTENMRQQGDGLYAEMLNDLRVGKVAEAEAELRKRVWVDPEGKTGAEAEVKLLRKLKGEGKKPVCLVPMVKQALELNVAMLMAEKLDVKFVHARDSKPAKGKAKRPAKGVEDADKSMGYDGIMGYLKKHNNVHKKKTGNLAAVLPLAVGARVMLSKNVDLDRGLFNGAMGTVTGFVKSRKKEDDIVNIKVIFDKDTDEEIVVKRTAASWEPSPGIMMRREQFPLELSYAITIHKCQGLSLDCVVANLGNEVFETGQAYVALSRARSLEGLYLLAYEPGGVRYDPDSVDEYNRMRALYTNLGPLEAAEQKPRKARKRVMRKSVEEMMAAVSPTKSPTKKKTKKVRFEDEQSAVEVVAEVMAEAEPEERDEMAEKPKGMNQDWSWVRAAVIAAENMSDTDPEEEVEVEVEVEEVVQLGFVPLTNSHPRRRGVENICFVNSSVQMLLGSGVMREWLTEEQNVTPGLGEAVKSEMKSLMEAMKSRDGQKRNARKIRDAVAQYSVGLNAEDYGDLQQHCSMDFVVHMMSLCGERMQELFRFERKAKAKCLTPGCGQPEVQRRTTMETELNLYLGEGRGEVTLEKLMDEELLRKDKMRCVQCSKPGDYLVNEKGEFLVNERGQRVPNEGEEFDVVNSIRVTEKQRLLLLRVFPFVWDTDTGSEKRSERKLAGLDPGRVVIGDITWRVMGGVKHIGANAQSGHYEAFLRHGEKWRHISDESCREVDALPVSELYSMLMERCD